MEEKTIKQNEPTLKEKVLRGSTWTLVGFGAARVLRLGSHLILAWLLAPEIFGIMALVKVFMQGLEMFSDIGIGPSIIQNKRGHDTEFQNTAWTIQVLRGTGLWIITCLLAYPFSLFYAKSDPAASQLLYLLPVAGLTVLIGGFNHPVLYTMRKDLRLGVVTLIELSTQVVSLAVMIVWALIKPTVWAMVAGNIVSVLFKAIVSHTLVAKHRVRFQWDKECLHELITFGRWIMLSTAFAFLSNNLDKLILGKVLSLRELGLYGIATTLTKMALDVTTRLGSSVMFPVYSKFQDNTKKLMTVALQSRDVVLWVGGAVCIAIAVGSPLFFQSFWDSRYHYAGYLAQWLVFDMWSRILLCTMDRIPLSLGNSKSHFISNVIQTVGMIAAAGGYKIAGLPGFIIGLAMGPILAHIYLTLIIPVKRKNMLFQSMSFSIVASGLGIAAVLFINWLEKTVTRNLWMTGVIITALVPCLVALIVVFYKIRKSGALKNIIKKQRK